MKLICTADLHQHTPKWEALSAVVEDEKPAFVLIAGDLFPKTGGFKGQHDFFPRFQRNLAKMRDAGAQVLLMMGNDDFLPLEPLVDQLATQELCVNMNGRVHREQGLTFCGVAQVRDYPFAYKDWCVSDGDHVECPVQFREKGLTVNAYGHWLEIENVRESLLQRPSLGQRLESLAGQLSPPELPRSIWLVHQPPSDLGMDLCGDGQQVGSPTVLEFIKRHQPLLGVSGHIHESPYQPRGRWVALVNDTLWLQPGQMNERLHYIALEISEQHNLRHISHSILGRTPIEFERFPPAPHAD